MNWFHSENIKEEVKTVNNIQGVIVGMKTVPLDPAAINSSIKMSPKPNKTSQVSQLDNNPIHTEAGVSFVPTKRPIVSQVNTEEERTVSPQSEAEYLAMQPSNKSRNSNCNFRGYYYKYSNSNYQHFYRSSSW